MSFPEHRLYQRLYRRFIEGGTQPREFIEWAGRQHVVDKATLDLCAGGGAMTEALVAAGAARVVMVDSEEKMISHDLRFKRPSHVSMIIKHVVPALDDLYKHGALFDAVFCRQGINYWLTYENTRLKRGGIFSPEESVLVKLARVMKPGAPFIFNTFAQWPNEKDPPQVKQYTIDGDHYVEVSYYKFGLVHHVQIVGDEAPHVTSFQAFSKPLLYDIFEKDFNLTIAEKGKTLICSAKRK